MEQSTLICVLIITIAATTQGFRFREKHDRHREKRSGDADMDPRKNCNQWSEWINSHTPNETDRHDKEYVTLQEMDTFCPPDHGGNVTAIGCSDEKGEPFRGNHTNNRHDIFCNDPVTGIVCVLKEDSDVCPDLKMRYLCSCSYETTVTTVTDTASSSWNSDSTVHHEVSLNSNTRGSSMLLTTTKDILTSIGYPYSVQTSVKTRVRNTLLSKARFVTEPPVSGWKHERSSNTNKRNFVVSTSGDEASSSSNNEKPLNNVEKSNSSRTECDRFPWWILFVSEALTLIAINVCTVICVYKHKKKQSDNKEETKVHPIEW